MKLSRPSRGEPARAAIGRPRRAETATRRTFLARRLVRAIEPGFDVRKQISRNRRLRGGQHDILDRRRSSARRSPNRWISRSGSESGLASADRSSSGSSSGSVLRQARRSRRQASGSRQARRRHPRSGVRPSSAADRPRARSAIKRRAQRRDPHPGGDATTSASTDAGSAATRSDLARAAANSIFGRPRLDVPEADVVRSTIKPTVRADGGRRSLVVASFVERDEAEPRRAFHREAVALQHCPCRAPRQAARRPEATRSAIASTRTPPSACAMTPGSATGRPAAWSPRCRARQQSVVGNRAGIDEWASGGSASSKGEPGVTHRTRAGPHDDAGSERVDGKQGRCEVGARPGGGGRARRAHAGKISSKARSTRTAEPASSSGLRRAGGSAPSARHDAIGRRRPRFAVQARERPRRANERQFAAQAVRAKSKAETGGACRSRNQASRQRQPCARGLRCVAQLALFARPFLMKGLGVALERVAGVSRPRSASGTSDGVLTSMARPNRSSNWGRNSPSSGLPLPMRTKRAG